LVASAAWPAVLGRLGRADGLVDGRDAVWPIDHEAVTALLTGSAIGAAWKLRMVMLVLATARGNVRGRAAPSG
jgi:hypothetical protein